MFHSCSSRYTNDKFPINDALFKANSSDFYNSFRLNSLKALPATQRRIPMPYL